jgi:hypothetical protein
MSNELATIQSEIKANKSQFNKFGGYAYRSCEDIVEAAKPVLLKHGYNLTLSDEIVMIGNRYYVRATVSISNGTQAYSSTAFAREEETKKGMDASQITGAASSYARKYALNGLFAIDDTKDADTQDNTKTEEKKGDSPKQEGGNSDDKPWLNENTKEFNGAKEKLAAGTTTIDKIKQFYKISKAVQAKLLNQ